jgi:hypothetical protein
MPATKAYTRINFENYPSTNTPLNATNLNKVDKGIDDLDDLLVTARNNIETLQSNATTDEANILGLQENVGDINDNLTKKVTKFSGTDSGNTYVTVDGLAYDATNKRLGLKVNGADPVIPFNSGFTQGQASYISSNTANPYTFTATQDANRIQLIGYRYGVNNMLPNMIKINDISISSSCEFNVTSGYESICWIDNIKQGDTVSITYPTYAQSLTIAYYN